MSDMTTLNNVDNILNSSYEHTQQLGWSKVNDIQFNNLNFSLQHANQTHQRP